MGINAGIRSGWHGSTGSEGSKMCPMRLFAQIREVTPLSQVKKSSLEVRVGMWETEGKVFETAGNARDKVGSTGVGGEGFTGNGSG